MKHSIKVCRVKKCEHLERRKVETAAGQIIDGTRMQSFCSRTGKVPNDMASCPLEVSLDE